MPAAIFYSPHADDETLSMGVGIRNHIVAGYDVYVILLSHGRASNAYNVLAGTQYCSWHAKYHNPSSEGYAPFDKRKFGLTRVNEFINACLALGVPYSNIAVYDLEDGQFTKDQVKAIIQEWVNRVPGAGHKTMTYKDNHPDHVACGQALLELYNAGIIGNARFYIKREQYDQINGFFETYDSSYYPYIQAAANVYKNWAPTQGKLAVGYHSVKSTFDALLSDPRSKLHRPNE